MGHELYRVRLSEYISIKIEVIARHVNGNGLQFLCYEFQELRLVLHLQGIFNA